ncbi:AAA family ATPase [Micromonospora sp. DR5-3]|uniref:adenylate/guanylate cyclase domain-containing protein n=1 Tax=unclassified Micromonospora TaxID=2617518 RepID=UPI0011D51AF3|nr:MULTISPECIES: adenylate/guanylate cyclase domain-containing protein [unclassified Micromonospora]MCW3815235.1 AAA family ATPase [Micromonospora sp. DR5-3]TYC21333.1 AAA family ATPase [Micromonospora sp. MP36]
MPMTTIVGSREAVTAARWPVPEERRTVTVLFADIVGSTGLVERLDPEDVRELQRAYFGTVAGVLRRWHGVVEKYVGDAVMALFGAHGSDGFDAYRAVRAGLEIQEALDRRAPAGLRLRVRVGVATGEALVDLAATRDGGHGTASGAVITTAARIQEYAPPGGVVVCAATRRATDGLVDQRPLAALTVAGKALPLDVWRVLGVARPRPARHRGPLVGRRRELAAAGEEIARAVRDRRPRWVSLVGPAGSGRSRVLHELTRAVSTVDGAPVRWCMAHCPPYPEGDLTPLADMVRAFARVRDTDPTPTVRRRLATALDGLLPPAHRGAAAHALAEFVAAPQDAGAAGRGAEVWREVLLDLAAGQPTVVAVDDLDRAAPALNRFLHRLFATASERGLPLAVVATHGPGWADLLPGATGQRRRVPLPALGAVDTGRLLRHLLDRAGRPAALARELLPLTGGNPAAAQAYVRALAEDGDPGAVPDAVRRRVDARLDRLDGDQRAVLMAGAAHGTEFPATTMDRLLGWTDGRAERVLGSLVAAGLLRRTGLGGYAIAEPTVARVARNRLPRALRAEFARRGRIAPQPAVAAPAEAGLGPTPLTGAGAHPDAIPATAGLAGRSTAGPRAGAPAACPTVAGRPPRPGSGRSPAPVGTGPAARRKPVLVPLPPHRAAEAAHPPSPSRYAGLPHTGPSRAGGAPVDGRRQALPAVGPPALARRGRGPAYGTTARRRPQGHGRTGTSAGPLALVAA